MLFIQHTKPKQYPIMVLGFQYWSPMEKSTRLRVQIKNCVYYDSDPLDAKLRVEGIELIAPHRRNRVKPKTWDGCKLRRYKRCWKIERLNAWLQNYRRVLIRYEHKVENFLGLVQLACILILLKAFLR
jgi:hypothetical protein